MEGQPKKKRAPRKPTPRLGDIPVSKAARDVLGQMEQGAKIVGLRTFPFDWEFQLHASNGTDMPEQLSSSLVDVLVRTRCIETASNMQGGVIAYSLTVRGADAANGRGFDAVPRQADILDEIAGPS